MLAAEDCTEGAGGAGSVRGAGGSGPDGHHPLPDHPRPAAAALDPASLGLVYPGHHTSLCPRYTWTCCQDSLGRVACLPSVPVASLSLSLVSLVKAMHDLNLGPLVAGPPSLRRLRLSARLGLGLLPCLLATAVFRIAAAR